MIELQEQLWFKKFGYEEDPFHIRPTPEANGRQKTLRKTAWHALSGNIALLSGESGSGKTSLLKCMEKTLNENGFQCGYINLNAEELDTEKIFPAKEEGKKRVLLLDDADRLSFGESEKLKHLFDASLLHSIILASSNASLHSASASFKNRVSEAVKLEQMREKELEKVLEERLHKENPLEEKIREMLLKKAEGNPRTLLIHSKNFCMNFQSLLEENNDYRKKSPLKRKALREKIFLQCINGLPAEKALPSRNVTPLQRRILEALKKKPMGLKELSDFAGTTVGSTGKQLSILLLRTKKYYMEKKGIVRPLIEKDKSNAQTIYSITREGKKVLRESQA